MCRQLSILGNDAQTSKEVSRLQQVLCPFQHTFGVLLCYTTIQHALKQMTLSTLIALPSFVNAFNTSRCCIPHTQAVPAISVKVCPIECFLNLTGPVFGLQVDWDRNFLFLEK